MKRMLLGGHGGRSGVPRYVCQLAREFDDNETFVVSDENLGGYDDIIDLKIPHFEVRGLASQNFRYAFSAFFELRRIVNRERPEVIWANSSVSICLVRFLLLFHSNSCKLITVYHGLPFGIGRGFLRSFIMFLTEFFTVRFFKNETCVFISQKDFRNSWFLPSYKKRILINNCATDQFDFSDSSGYRVICGQEEIIICMTTRISKQKNIDSALNIFKQLPDNFVLWLLGEGTEETGQFFIENISRDSALRSRVKGFGSIDDVRPFLQASDLYLMTSRYEGFPLGALEALSMGLPIVMTDVGGREELSVAMGEAFNIIDVDDPSGSAEKIRSLTKNLRDFVNVRDRLMDIYRVNFSSQVWKGKVHNAENE